jgi:hypothetical protein
MAPEIRNFIAENDAHLSSLRSKEELLELVRRYARQQREYGNPEPSIVRTIADAYAVLNIAAPHFAPVPRFGSG